MRPCEIENSTNCHTKFVKPTQTPSRAPEPSMPPEVTMDGASRAIAQARAARAAATNQIDQRVKTMKARFTYLFFTSFFFQDSISDDFLCDFLCKRFFMQLKFNFTIEYYRSPVRGEGQPATATSPHQQWNNPTTAQSPWKGSFQPESNNNNNNPFGFRDPSPAAYSMRSVGGASPNQGRLRSAERSPTKSKLKKLCIKKIIFLKFLFFALKVIKNVPNSRFSMQFHRKSSLRFSKFRVRYKARRQYTPGNPSGTAISKSSTGTSSTSRQVLPQAAPPTSTDTSFNIAS